MEGQFSARWLAQPVAPRRGKSEMAVPGFRALPRGLPGWTAPLPEARGKIV